jgi:hypothetical protein
MMYWGSSPRVFLFSNTYHSCLYRGWNGLSNTVYSATMSPVLQWTVLMTIPKIRNFCIPTCLRFQLIHKSHLEAPPNQTAGQHPRSAVDETAIPSATVANATSSHLRSPQPHNRFLRNRTRADPPAKLFLFSTGSWGGEGSCRTHLLRKRHGQSDRSSWHSCFSSAAPGV